jgi:polyisoprenoid-binding protein YceI
MRFNKSYLSIIIVLFLLTGFSALTAQEGFQIGSSQEFKVSGTSSLHDWDMTSEGARGEASIIVEGNEIKEIKSLRVDLPVKTLKSGNNRMDRTAYGAIDADKHQYVRFELTSVRNITANQVLASGNLTLAGNTRPVAIRAGYKVTGNTLQFVGAHSIKFSQFDVDPPTALLGSVRTGDDLMISFDVNFNPSPSARAR